jgi:hypothetical protein
MKKVFAATGVFAVSAMAMAGCGGAPSSDPAAEQVLQRLQSGKLIEEMNRAQEKGGRYAQDFSALLEDEGKGTWGVHAAGDGKGTWGRFGKFESDTGRLGETHPGSQRRVDPCPEVGSPRASDPEPVRRAELNKLGACMRRLSEKGYLINAAFTAYRLFTPPAGSKSIADMSADELSASLSGEEVRHPLELLGTQHPLLTRLRTRYTDADVEEMRRIAAARRAAFFEAEKAIFEAMESRMALVESYRTIDRYNVLLALKATRDDREGRRTYQALTNVRNLRTAPPGRMEGFPYENLHPYAIQAVVPDPDKETEQLSLEAENPFERAAEMMYQFENPDSPRMGQLLLAYSMMSMIDNSPIPNHPAPHAQAARVAVLDSGADWMEFPDLGQFLGRGAEGRADEMVSKDFSDLDNSAWIPAIGGLSHGSGTMATVLTIAAHYAPEVIRERRIDVGMWKDSTVRGLLSGSIGEGMPYFDLRQGYSIHHAIQDRVAAAVAGQGVTPDIVSVSLRFPSWPVLDREGLRDTLLKAPWLWVMAAGNSGEDVAVERRTCFEDVPRELRRDENILCVGALEQGIVNDKITDYSNFGSRVDVYAYESYIRICPNGTSCSTPAVSGAAAVLKAKFPSLTPAQMKQAIVNAAETRTLPVSDPAREAIEGRSFRPRTRTIKVFDPTTMMSRALAQAEALVAAPQLAAVGE